MMLGLSKMGMVYTGVAEASFTLMISWINPSAFSSENLGRMFDVGRTDYEYTIDGVTGAILEYEQDID